MNATIEKPRVCSSRPNPMLSWSDEKLLLSYRSDRDTGAFEELVHRYEKELYGYLRHYLGNVQMAEDVFQQTFLQVHIKCDQFEAGKKVRPWLYTVATNQAIDYQRTNRRHRMSSLNRVGASGWENGEGEMIGLLGGDEGCPDDNAESAEQYQAMRRAVDALPELARQVVMLVYFQGLKYREAAQILGLPVGTVKSRLHDAMLKLTKEFAQPTMLK